MSRKRRKRDDRYIPGKKTKAAFADLAGCRTIADMLALEHAGSGPREHDVVHVARVVEVVIEEPKPIEDRRYLGDSESVRHRRLVLLRSLTPMLEPVRMILRRLPEDYEINCPTSAAKMLGQDLSWLAKHGHVRKDGAAGGTRWSLPAAEVSP